jgi:hypothetical protein
MRERCCTARTFCRGDRREGAPAWPFFEGAPPKAVPLPKRRLPSDGASAGWPQGHELKGPADSPRLADKRSPNEMRAFRDVPVTPALPRG